MGNEREQAPDDIEKTEIEEWLTVGAIAKRLGKTYDWVQPRIQKYYLEFGELRPDSRNHLRVMYPPRVYTALEQERDHISEYPIVSAEDLAINALSVAIGKDEKWISVRMPYLEIEGTEKLNPVNNRLFTYYTTADQDMLQAEVDRMAQYPVAGEDDVTETGLVKELDHGTKWIRRRMSLIAVTSTIKMNPGNYQLARYFPKESTVQQIKGVEAGLYPVADETEATERGLAKIMGHSVKWLRRRLKYVVVTPVMKRTIHNKQPRLFYPIDHTAALIEALPEHIDHLKLRIIPEHPAVHEGEVLHVRRAPISIRGWDGTEHNVTADNWRDFAECATTDPEIFMPEKGGRDAAREAKKICANCAAKLFCLDYAIATNQQEGIWGGKSLKERRAIQRVKV